MKQVFIVPQFHCDVVWRRPPAEQTRIRAHQYASALETLRREPAFRFEFDQARLVREFLDAHPRWLEPMRRLVREGRLEITGGGETIPDTNMPCGEGLIRNLLLGRIWFEETLGAAPIVANMDDAFGMSGQLPQIFRQFGYRWFRNSRMPGLDPEATRRGLIWQGLDGSRIFSGPVHGNVELVTHVCNLPVIYRPAEFARHSLEQAFAGDRPVTYWQYCSEEDLVDGDIVRMILARVRRRGADARFGLAREALAAMERRGGRVPVVAGEFNPCLTGCYVTRIGVKQGYRAAEQGTLAAEAAAACAALDGAAYPRARLLAAWRSLAFIQFHDALCGCHTREVNRAVLRACGQTVRAAGGMAAAAVRALSPRRGRRPGVVLFNPLPWPRREAVPLDVPAGFVPAAPDGTRLPAERHGAVTCAVVDLPPMGCLRLPLRRGSAPRPRSRARAAGRSFEVGPHRIVPRDDGLRIERRDWNRVLADGPFPEVRFRNEDGTLWEERLLGPVFAEAGCPQRLVEASEGPVALRLRWRGAVDCRDAVYPSPPGWVAQRQNRRPVAADLERLSWEKEIVFHRHGERIDVRVDLDFRGRNTEVRLAFPLRLDLARARALYETPCAVLERRPYFEVPASSPEPRDPTARPAGRGSWPALNWVAYRDGEWGMALANRGTPAHRLIAGCIEAIVLRSPTMMASGFNVTPDAHDNGRHTFRFALQPFRGDPRDGTAYRLGATLNRPPVARRALLPADAAPGVAFLELDAPGVAFDAWKRAERGAGFVLRTHECRGRAAAGRVKAGFPVARVRETDLTENPLRPAGLGKLRWRPFEIKTLLIEPETKTRQ